MSTSVPFYKKLVQLEELPNNQSNSRINTTTGPDVLSQRLTRTS